ncbi:hypothetical protein AB835_07305 [Candidatus Endobugula sertula]|uniref:Type I secretion protein TolC n=1 Tax=Candidatus Endobugula sertula TaxID=62101 RepID=A0A1D2QQE6_9GAMM|nr:hypothetical protein AB835_07305 [Candidatus Endobugula sertula]
MFARHTIRIPIHLLGILCLSISIHTYGNGETLLDIYALAKQNDHQFKSDYAKYQAAIEVAAIKRSALLPQINGTGTVSHTHHDISGSLPEETNNNANSYGISISQSILNISAGYADKQGKVEKRIAAINYQASQQALIIRSAKAYFDVLRAKDQLQTANAEKKAQATLLKQTRQRYEVGLISINNVHETQAAYDNAVANAINATAKLDIQYDSLTILTGKLHTKIIPLKDNFNAEPPIHNQQQTWVDVSIKNNYALRASELTAESARISAKAASSKHLPTIDSTATYKDQSIDAEGGSNTVTDSKTTEFSLNLKIPLYAGGKVSAEKRQAAQKAIKAKEDFLLTYRKTVQNVRSLYRSVTTDIAQIKARKQAIISNESALKATKAGYDAGTRDIVDIVNAQSKLFQAQRNYFDTLYNYIINTLLLKEAAGNLQLSDLEHLEKSLDKK